MLAIVIPYYKPTFFEETLSSLASQTNKNFKVYIGNDASPDDPMKLINSFQKELKITYKRFDYNVGGTSLTKQWERCIELIQDEEWIMILGDDDFLAPNVIEIFYEDFPKLKGKTQVIRFATKLICEEPKSVSSVFKHPVWENVQDSYKRKIENSTRSSLSEYIFSKKTYLEYGFYPYPLGWYSDDRAWFEFTAGKPIFSINSALVYIRNSPFNISSSKDNLTLKQNAKRGFLHYLILEKFYLFSYPIQIKILRFYENSFTNFQKVRMYDWLQLFYFYAKYSQSYDFKKFLKRRVKSFNIFSS